MDENTAPATPAAPEVIAPTAASPPSAEGRFLRQVAELAPGERAILRRNAGHTLSEARGCFWFYRLLDKDLSGPWDAERAFLVATLMCGVRDPKRGLAAQGDFGSAMAQLRHKSASGDAIQRRFGILLDADFGDAGAGGELAFRLRQLVRLANSRDVPIPWESLLKDLGWWGSERRSVQKRWAASFFQTQPNP